MTIISNFAPEFVSHGLRYGLQLISFMLHKQIIDKKVSDRNRSSRRKPIKLNCTKIKIHIGKDYNCLNKKRNV